MTDTTRAAGDGGPPREEGGVDYGADVERIHRAIRREPLDPIEGREPAPWFMWVVIAIALFWGGWYFGRFFGEFGVRTHTALGTRDQGTRAQAARQTATAVNDPVAAGSAVYDKHCSSCHQATALGVPGAFPPLLGSEWVVGPDETIVRILLFGLQGPVQVAGATYNGLMPAWREVLKDEEIAAVATYVRQRAPNAAPPVAPALVTRLRGAHSDRSKAWTADELRALERRGTGDSSRTKAGGSP
jgi:mono/diheme cytochrome c family protein